LRQVKVTVAVPVQPECDLEWAVVCCHRIWRPTGSTVASVATCVPLALAAMTASVALPSWHAPRER